MSILSDRQIKALCTPPATYFDQAGYEAWLAKHIADVILMTTDLEEVKKTFQRVSPDAIKDQFVPMIAPFMPQSVKEVTTGYKDNRKTFKTLSFGSTSYGYDLRLGEEFKIFTNVNGGEIDPKSINTEMLATGVLKEAQDGSRYVILPPNSYLLGVTVEYFNMPRDVMCICVGKSTYSRAGAIVNLSPIEPGFKGKIVIEIANATSLPMRIYANEGISQFIFFKGSEECEVSYADRSGKYQGQNSLTLGKV